MHIAPNRSGNLASPAEAFSRPSRFGQSALSCSFHVMLPWRPCFAPASSLAAIFARMAKKTRNYPERRWGLGGGELLPGGICTTRGSQSMTTNVAGTAPMVFAPSREELICVLRKRYPRISGERLGKLLDHRLALGVIDVVCNSTGEDRRYDAASATHAEKWLIIEGLDGEIG
jgi:hypothetical protein